jgi:hypothetical protein
MSKASTKPTTEGLAKDTAHTLDKKGATILPAKLATKIITKIVVPSSANDLIPSFKIFSLLIAVTIFCKVLFQYAYSDSSFSESSAVKPQFHYKTYVLYYLTLVWAFCLLVNIYAIASRTGGCTVSTSITNFYPLILVIGILGWIIYQNTNFYKIINEGKAPSKYGWIDLSVNVLLIIQVTLIYKYINEQMCPENGKRNEIIVKWFHYVCLFLSILSFGFMGWNEWILRTEITDG